MSIKFHQVRARYEQIDVQLQTSKGEIFFVRISADGFEFLSDVSSSGNLSGNPIKKNADDLLEWVGKEGLSKPFRDRAQVRKNVKE